MFLFEFHVGDVWETLNFLFGDGKTLGDSITKSPLVFRVSRDSKSLGDASRMGGDASPDNTDIYLYHSSNV